MGHARCQLGGSKTALLMTVSLMRYTVRTIAVFLRQTILEYWASEKLETQSSGSERYI